MHQFTHACAYGGDENVTECSVLDDSVAFVQHNGTMTTHFEATNG